MRMQRYTHILAYGALALLVLGAFGAGGWGLFTFYQQEKQSLTTQVEALESQVAALSAALQESSEISEENKQQIQELVNRREVRERSQSDLLTDAVSEAAPAVVSIVVSRDVPLLEVQYVNPFGDDPHFRDFGIRIPAYRQVGEREQRIGAGTGFLIREDGYILTNRHVVSEPDARYTALLSDGTQREARVVYRDKTHDIAIIKIEGGGYPALALGDSSNLKLGQTVAAIGNALGEYNNSVSVGIISGLNRTIEARDARGRLERLTGVLQTDAAINRGNSGGPLINLNGRVVGINVAKEYAASNIAFAIPIDTIKPIISDVLP